MTIIAIIAIIIVIAYIAKKDHKKNNETEYKWQKPLSSEKIESKYNAWRKKADTYRESSIINENEKGEYGEKLIQEKLRALQGEHEYYTMKNVYIPYHGRTAEIDLLMIHEKGIYVFESKNYSGWIFGNRNNDQWTQSLYTRSGVKQNKFYNPIMQNASHIKALNEYVGFPERIKPVSVIVFSERCELKAVPNNDETLIICQRNELLNELRNHIANSKIQISSQKLAEYNKIIEKCTEAPDTIKAAHTNHVKKYK